MVLMGLKWMQLEVMSQKSSQTGLLVEIVLEHVQVHQLLYDLVMLAYSSYAGS